MRAVARLPFRGPQGTPIQRIQCAYTGQQPQQLQQQQQQQPQQLQRQQQQHLTAAEQWSLGRSCFQRPPNSSSSSSSSSSERRSSLRHFGSRPASSNSSSSSSSSSTDESRFEDIPSSSSSSSSGSSSCRGLGGVCLNCKEPFGGIRIICKGCGEVLPLSYPPSGPVSAFAVFDLPPTFDVSLPVVFARYKQLQQKLHPDKIAAKTPEERALCEIHRRQLVAAKETLQDPAKRAEHLLALQGRDAGETLDDRVDEPEILVAVMQIHEQLDACKTRDEVDRLTSLVKDIADGLEARLSVAIMLEDLREARALIKRLRLYVRVLQRTANVDFSSSET